MHISSVSLNEGGGMYQIPNTRSENSVQEIHFPKNRERARNMVKPENVEQSNTSIYQSHKEICIMSILKTVNKL